MNIGKRSKEREVETTGQNQIHPVENVFTDYSERVEEVRQRYREMSMDISSYVGGGNTKKSLY